MSTGDHREMDPYSAPEAALREDLPPRGWVHPPVAFASGLAGLLLIDGDFNGEFLSLFVVSSLLAALALTWFRRMDWRVAIVLGVILSLGTSLVLSFIGMKLGF